MSDMFSYFAYGLRIRADMPLPELVVEETENGAEEEVRIRFGRLDDPPSAVTEKYCGHLSSAPQEDYLFWEDVGLFLVREGRDIIFDPSGGLDERAFRLFALGPVLTVLLRQRGYFILHASAVAAADGAVLFLGDAGCGKSTTAAALHARGHALVADDVAVIRAEEGHPVIFPGFPQLKLWPEALLSLGDDPEKLPQCNPRLEKRARSAAHKFSPASLPLKKIYVLEKGSSMEILPIRPQEALGELVRHTYGGMGVGSTPHFLECASIVNKVPVRSLRRQVSLSQLPRLVRLVEEDLAQSA